MGVFKLAWRNIWRNRRRTIVTVGAMTLALFVMVLYTGLVEGYLQDLEHNILDLELGDLQVHAKGYLDNPSIYTRIEKTEALLAKLKKIGYPACARLLGGGLVASGESSAGALLRGLDIKRDASVVDIDKHVASGKWLDPGDPKGVVLGRRLARTLGIRTGDELVILSQATDGSMANDIFTVRGILKGISDATDHAGVFMISEAFRELFVLTEGSHQIIVRRPADKTLSTAVNRVQDFAPELDVKTWRELVPTLANLLDSARGVIMLVFFIIYIVIAILILNAILMAVFERIREFGVLKALGVGPRRVILLIFTESGLQMGLAIAVALSLSLPGLWYLMNVGIDTGRLGGMSMMGMAFTSTWYAIVTPTTFTGPVFILVFMVFIAVLYPAIKAARISPVKAMRYQ